MVDGCRSWRDTWLSHEKKLDMGRHHERVVEASYLVGTF